MPAIPKDDVKLTAPTPRRPPPAAGLAQATQAAGHQSAWHSAFGAVAGVALRLARPIASPFRAAKFMMGFMGSMRTRAEEISKNPDRVEAQLAGTGMHRDYESPKNHTNVKLVGEMTIHASMAEFFRLWASWIDHGYGSINDRQYADLIRGFCEQAKANPFLEHMPMTSLDAFQVEIQDGKMVRMNETTTNKMAGMPTGSRVDWAWTRHGDPRASNSFEKTVDDFNGDLAAVEAFYNKTFDPKNLDPNSKSTVEFRIRAVDELPPNQPGAAEFRHSVHLPLSFMLPHPATTLAIPGPSGAGVHQVVDSLLT